MTLTRGQKSKQKGKCKHGHCLTLSNTAWCDLNSKSDLLKLHDKCANSKCSCQKMITLTPRQLQMEGSGFKSKLQKNFKGTQSAWNKFSNHAVNVAAPFTDMAVGAKTKNPQVAQATTKNLISMSGGKILSLTDMHSVAGLRLRAMRF